MDYIIISGTDSSTLEGRVVKLMKEGYQLYGDLKVTAFTEASNVRGVIIFTQVLVIYS